MSEDVQPAECPSCSSTLVSPWKLSSSMDLLLDRSMIIVYMCWKEDELCLMYLYDLIVHNYLMVHLPIRSLIFFIYLYIIVYFLSTSSYMSSILAHPPLSTHHAIIVQYQSTARQSTINNSTRLRHPSKYKIASCWSYFSVVCSLRRLEDEGLIVTLFLWNQKKKKKSKLKGPNPAHPHSEA